MPFHLAIWASKVSKKFELDRKIGFQNTFYIKCVNVIFDSIGPSIILRSIKLLKLNVKCINLSTVIDSHHLDHYARD